MGESEEKRVSEGRCMVVGAGSEEKRAREAGWRGRGNNHLRVVRRERREAARDHVAHPVLGHLLHLRHVDRL